MIFCTSRQYRRAYGWQRDGGMADFMLAEEKDLIALPDELSYADGAQVACGFGTVFCDACSANDAARATAIRATRKWRRIVFLGEGGRVEFNPPPDIIHD